MYPDRRKAVGKHDVSWGDLRRTRPFCDKFGLSRGLPVDRYYIEQFLSAVRHLIGGSVLEIGESTYTRKFGGDRVKRSDVLHAEPGDHRSTIVGDLATGESIPTEAFDCMILTQTLHLVYDVKAAIANIYRALKPGGILLATVPGISQISRYDMDRWGDYWRFTSLSARRLFEEAFPRDGVTVEVFGNVAAAVAFLHGLAAEELDPDELTHQDPDYELLVTIRAVKPGPGS